MLNKKNALILTITPQHLMIILSSLTNVQVSDFTWSHDGTQALISYRDGFVLVGSVSGQRHWSSEINLESQITCGIWTPDDQQVTHIHPTEL